MDTIKQGIIVGVVAGIVAPIAYEAHDAAKRWQLMPIIGTLAAYGAGMAAIVRALPDSVVMTSAEYFSFLS